MEQVPVAVLEFVDGGNTIWVHNNQGATVLRIKTMGKISVNRDCQNICSHADIITGSNIEICMAKEDQS